MPLFTIATITYNQEQWVRQAIESVLASSFTDFEYIIADDRSTDKTWEIIQEYKDPRIRAWRNDPNLGEYPNRNNVLENAKGEYILFVDGDDILYRYSLEEYARYINVYPETCGVWGVHPFYLDFIVYPYLISPGELSRLNFLSNVPISVIGLTESVFKVTSLRQIGGFDPQFGIADTHAKKKFGCFFPVVLTPVGKAFWRQSPNQASQRVRRNMRNLVETFLMDEEILASGKLPLNEEEMRQAWKNFRNRRMKLVFSMTILKLDIYNFFRLMKTLRIPFTDIVHLLKNADYSYQSGADAAAPLMTDFNFRRGKEVNSVTDTISVQEPKLK
ncbi:MAG TPA: glycosyltransferase family A protein [Flavipsychrobacter sp.]|mgnify:CR=1 FL=1|nr:glycosyltransferase family A protein [Flavipsychrobacter sp.]